MEKSVFTVLIGSYARGQGSSESDVDILRIGHQTDISRPVGISEQSPISYIDFDQRDFYDLHKSGSLFLYHVFSEGVLLKGCEADWLHLCETFIVTKNHSQSILEYLGLLDFIDNYPKFHLAYMPYLSQVFKALKNIGIFKLAERESYAFDKTTSLVNGCGLSRKQADLFIASNVFFERNVNNRKYSKHDFAEFALEWKSMHTEIMQRIQHDRKLH